jgi:hypothetical protein
MRCHILVKAGDCWTSGGKTAFLTRSQIQVPPCKDWPTRGHSYWSYFSSVELKSFVHEGGFNCWAHRKCDSPIRSAERDASSSSSSNVLFALCARLHQPSAKLLLPFPVDALETSKHNQTSIECWKLTLIPRRDQWAIGKVCCSYAARRGPKMGLKATPMAPSRDTRKHMLCIDQKMNEERISLISSRIWSWQWAAKRQTGVIANWGSTRCLPNNSSNRPGPIVSNRHPARRPTCLWHAYGGLFKHKCIDNRNNRRVQEEDHTTTAWCSRTPLCCFQSRPARC